MRKVEISAIQTNQKREFRQIIIHPGAVGVGIYRYEFRMLPLRKIFMLLEHNRSLVYRRIPRKIGNLDYNWYDISILIYKSLNRQHQGRIQISS